MAGHGCHVDVCACGAVQAQCRCATPGKPRRVVRESCLVCMKPTVEAALGVKPKSDGLEFDIKVSPADMTPGVVAEIARALMVRAQMQEPRMLSISFLVYAVRVTATVPNNVTVGWRERMQTVLEIVVNDAIKRGEASEAPATPGPALGVTR